ncbi:Nuclear receptor subfamily 2 group E member 1 [Aphelenchoides bicaudatus]|nr:Nuclear receptor subfamily 2 group E member 1 [Aphelenchoides bicaudatus]
MNMETDIVLAPRSVESIEGSSPSTSNDSMNGSTTVHSPANAECCPVCGDTAWNKHFGVLCCNACAAFFRRTVALRKSYICIRGKRCDVTQETSRHICKYCRFSRAIRVGMNIAAVFTRPPQNDFDAFEENALLRKLTECRNAVFVDRFNATIKVNNGRQDAVQLGKRHPTALDTVRATQAEFIVMTASLRQCGIRQMGIQEIELTKLGACLFYQWISFNCITATMRNGGHNINEAFFVDESHLPVEFDSIKAYIDTRHSEMAFTQMTFWKRKWNAAALLSFRFCRSVVNAAIKLHKSRLDDTEFAVMSQMMCLKMASRIFPDNMDLRRYMNVLFETLRQYYENNFDCVATKLGNLILLTNEIETVTFAFEESIVALNSVGYQPVLTQILRSQLFCENLFNSVSSLSKPEQANVDMLTSVC